MTPARVEIAYTCAGFGGIKYIRASDTGDKSTRNAHMSFCFVNRRSGGLGVLKWGRRQRDVAGNINMLLN